jgi:hypothetical protein
LSLMRIFIRRSGVYVWHTIVCMAVLALALSMFWAVSYALSVHHRRQAERMLQQLAALQPGASLFRTAQKIAKDSGGREYCTEQLCRYDFNDSFMFADSLLPRVLRRTEWDYLGLRPWWVYVLITKGSPEPTNVEIIAGVGRGRGWLINEGPLSGNMWASLMVSVTINSKRLEQVLKSGRETIGEEAIRTGRQLEEGSDGIIVKKPSFDTPGGGEALEVYLSPDAPPPSRRAAFDLNLRCATAMSPCTELCQLSPSAWRSYFQFIKSEGMSVGEPTDCAAANHQ